MSEEKKTTKTKKSEAVPQKAASAPKTVPAPKRNTAASGNKKEEQKRSSDHSSRAAAAPRAAAAEQPASAGLLHQFLPYLIFVLALFLTACFIFSGMDGAMGGVGSVLRNFFCGLFGWPAFLIPLILLNLALYWRKYVDLGMVAWKLAMGLLCLVSVASLVHSFYITSVYAAEAGEAAYSLPVWARSVFGTSGEVSNWTHGIATEGGGFFGGLVGGFIRSLCGYIGAPLIIITFLTLSTMFYFSITPGYVVTSVRYGIMKLKEKRAERREAAAEKEEEELRRKEAVLREREAKEEERRRAAEQKRTATVTPYDTPVTIENSGRGPVEVPGLRRRADGTPVTGSTKPVPELMPELQAAPDFVPTAAPAVPEAVPSSGRVSDALAASAADGKAEEPAAAPIPPAEKTHTSPAADGQTPASHGTVRLNSRGEAKAPARDRTASEILNEVFGPEHKKAAAPSVELQHMAPIPAPPQEPEDTHYESDTDSANRTGDQLDTYFFPPIELLNEPKSASQEDISAELRGNAQKIMDKLAAFKVKIRKIEYSRGPSITRYELYPDASTRVSSIANLQNDVALELAATIRMEAPIPNKNAVGIEVPNQIREIVFIREMLDSDKFKSLGSKLTACLGKDVGGNMVFFDIAKMPHLLIAGTTGSGKSVCLNTIILSLLYKARPDEVKFIMIDPKKIEMGMYNGLPHMKVPVVSDMKRAAGTLNAAVNEMEHRYTLFEETNSRDLDGYNRLMADGNPGFVPLPRLVIIIDELADLMMQAPQEIENSIIRLAQKARAAGIHLIVGTQRPSSNVITGLIKANIPSRIAFTVASNVDSRIIIDMNGAEKLIGKGDMLFAPIGSLKPARIQGAFVDDSEVRSVTEFIRQNSAKVEYDEDFLSDIERETDRLESDSRSKAKDSDEDMTEFSQEADPLFNKALHIAVENGTVATSLLQRKLSIGFGRGAKIIDRMEALGFVSGANGTKPRTVQLTSQQLMELEMAHDVRTQGRFT